MTFQLLKRVVSRLVAIPVLVMAGVGSFYVGGSLVDYLPPVQYRHAAAVSSTVPQGGTIDVEFDVSRNRLCEIVNVRRMLIDSEGEQHVIPTFTVGFPSTIGRDTYVRKITIPESAALGHAEYQVRIRYACNWWHRVSGLTINVYAPAIGFKITPKVSS